MPMLTYVKKKFLVCATGCLCYVMTWLCIPLSIKAQLTVSTHFGVEDGLVQNSVLSITQDNKGFMWFGTENGLSRFDGLRWRNFKNISETTSKSPSTVLIRSLFWDKQNRLWLGTSMGLFTFDPTTEKFKQILLPYSRQPEVKQVFTNRSGQILVATSSGVVLISKGERAIASKIPLLNGENILCYAIIEGSDGKIWCGTSKGLFEIKIKFNSITLTRESSQLPVFLLKQKITTIRMDNYGRFWFGSYASGLMLCEYKNGKFTEAKKQPDLPGGAADKIRAMISLLNHKIAVATANGLFIFDIKSLNALELNSQLGNEQTLRNNSIHSLFQQSSGTIWIGTYYSGLDLIKPKLSSFQHLSAGLPPLNLNHRVVSSMESRSQTEFWIGTEGGGINILNPINKHVSYLKNEPGNDKSISSNFIKTLFKDKDGNLWIGNFSGTLDVLNTQTNAIEHRLTGSERVTEVNSIVEDKLNRLWITTSGGLRIYKRNGTELKADPLEKKNIFRSFIAGTTFIDKTQRLWFISGTKVLKISGTTTSLYHLKYPVNTIAEQMGIIYFGMDGHGLGKFDEKSQQVIPYYLNSQVENRSVFGIAFDKHEQLWLASDSGLLKVNLKKKAATQYTKADGLISTDFNNHAKFVQGNNLFFGTFDGLVYFNPSEIHDNAARSSTVITGISVFNVPLKIGKPTQNKSVSYTKEIELSYDQNSLTFEFALLDFIKPKKNAFRYKLTGLSKNWTITNSADATFNNLAPGTYHLIVSGNNGSLNWSDPVSLIIRISPPFWATWWAYSFYTLILIGIVFLIIRYFVLQTLLKREDELHQYKINFFTNVSHEIRTHLSLISPPIEQLASDEQLGIKQKDKIMGIATNARRLLTLVNELLDFRKTEENRLTLVESVQDLLPIIEDCLQMFSETATRKQIKTVFEKNDIESAILWCDAFQLKKAVINLLANAYKFTPEGGCIKLKINQTSGEVNIIIADNGRGISKVHLDKLFENYYQVADHGFQNTGYGIGLALSKAIVELHQGAITVTSRLETMNEPGQTSFRISLPKRHKEEYEANLPACDENASTKQAIDQKHIEPLMPLIKSDDGLKPTVLLAEDNQELAALLVDILSSHYHVNVATNGKMAWEQAKRYIPDLIISDVTMPEMSGFDFCERIKSNVATNHIPFVMLTAKTQTEDIITGLSYGADVYLTKPFTPQALLLQVNNLIMAVQNVRVHVSQLFNKTVVSTDIFSQLSQTTIGVENQKFLDQLVEKIILSIENPEFGVNELATLMNMSTPILYKKVKSVSSLSVNDFIKGIRLKKAAELLQSKLYTVYQVSYMVGFSDSKYFSKEFKKFFGKLPSEWIKTI